MSCQQPGCTGQILDGYCDICGMPSGVGVAAPADDLGAPRESVPNPETPATPPPPPIVKRGGPCTQPGCHGTVVDGYCDMCGAPEGAAPIQIVEAKPESEPEVGGQSSITRGSSRIGSTALGSARAATTGTASTRRKLSGSARLRTAHIGAGLTRVPPAPIVDPATALMKNPEVPENKRNCPACENPVGRSRDGKPGRTEGFCPKCGAKFSFTPKLKPGDLVAGQYEVQGALAHGGMGWIYLARDKNVSDRWVVLKGLLNSEDKDLLASAIAEQQFLAQVQHPLIVEIYNFVTHEGSGYIVMEYVGGRSLKQLLKQRMTETGGAYNPLPVDQAIAFIVEVLPAFQYLHDNGLVYCDFKPDNVVQVGDGLKLIDLGGVRRMDDQESAIYGTIGYQAPEVASRGPSVASDLYTIGRTLIVLCAEFRGYQSTYEFSLPRPDEMPLFAEYDSLFRLLLKCCAPDPNDRFTSADELRTQLLGILREVVGSTMAGTTLTSSASLLFEPPTVSSDTFDWHQLPTLRTDPSDEGYDFLSQVDIEDPGERLAALAQAPLNSAEVELARARAALEMSNMPALQRVVTSMLTTDPWEWRAVWMQGMGALITRDFDTAQSSFNAVYGQVPGELAPKFALAVACEHGSEPDVAETLYAVCASTDANYVTGAAFGLARIRARRGDLRGALAALDMVPTTSRGYSESRRLRAQHLVALGSGLSDLGVAMSSISQAKLDGVTRARYTVKIYERALAVVREHGNNPQILVGDVPAHEKRLRDRLEQAYRDLAAYEKDGAMRAALIDKANQTRKWTLL